MKNQKMVFIIIGIVLVVLIGLGAIFVSKFATRSNGGGKVKEAAEKLSQRYQQDIVILEVYPKKIGQDYYEVDACPKNEPDVVFSATIDTKDDNFSDNYVERYICKQITKKIQDNIGRKEDIYILTETVGPQPITNDINQTIQEYAKLDPYNRFRVSIFTTAQVDDNWSSSAVFSGLDIDISGEVFTVNPKQLKEVKAFLTKHPNTNAMEYKEIIKNSTSRTI